MNEHELEINYDPDLTAEERRELKEVARVTEQKIDLVNDYVNKLNLNPSETLSVGMTLLMNGARETGIPKDMLLAVIIQGYEALVPGKPAEKLN